MNFLDVQLTKKLYRCSKTSEFVNIAVAQDPEKKIEIPDQWQIDGEKSDFFFKTLL